MAVAKWGVMTRQAFTVLLWLAALLAWPAASVAQDGVVRDRTLAELIAQVPGHPGISYFDLVKQVIPDLARDETRAIGHKTVPLRHIAGDGFGGTIPDPIRIGVLRAVPFEAEDKPRIALLIDIGKIDDLGEQPHILAVFDAAGRAPILLDAVDVGLDRATSLGEPALVRIGAHDDAILTTSQHFNSAENYTWTALIFLRGGKLELIDKFLAYSAWTCASQGKQAFSFKAVPGPNDTPYHAIAVTMSDIGTPPEERCDDGKLSAPYARTATAHYRWDAGKSLFVVDSDAVQRLQEQTAGR
ncbi:hypothetical protein [Shinella zoogloeoides]|uniref:Uncharacterized protein n=1 Tax=Shinella zoogloeoides TaxID=352475 RepID=A0A6N8TFJ3_SHIZO|nr:hypothetical protein [Shinella zoogloeoides]MXO02043.1 hypothetical protein [Shinella zoogloeoides]UEX81673.1 hypothetical protein K8M09_19290 [Shinella zoogloeoides]